MNRPWLIVDGYNLAFRSFYAVPPLTRSDGFPTNMLQGFVRMLWKLEDQCAPRGIFVAFDCGGSKRRLELFPSYKAHRPQAPEALRQQLPLIRDLADAMGYGLLESEGTEGDDLIAAYAQRLAQKQESVSIVSADKDFAQCLGPHVSQLLPAPPGQPGLGWQLLEASGVRAKFGVSVEQIPDYLALMGDVSDNIPGLEGVGPKTAQKWLAQYGSLAQIIAAAEHIEPKRFQTPLSQSASLLQRNLALTTLDKDQLPCALPAILGGPKPALLTFLEKMELNRAYAEARRRLEPVLSL